MRKKTLTTEEEKRSVVRKTTTLDELAMQPLKFSFEINESRTLHFKYGIGSSNPGFFLRVGKINESKRNYNRLPTGPLLNIVPDFKRGVCPRSVYEPSRKGKIINEVDLYCGEDR